MGYHQQIYCLVSVVYCIMKGSLMNESSLLVFKKPRYNCRLLIGNYKPVESDDPV